MYLILADRPLDCIHLSIELTSSDVRVVFPDFDGPTILMITSEPDRDEAASISIECRVR